MKAIVTGYSRTYGKGKASGVDYDMGRVYVLNGLAPIDKPNTKRECGGFEAIELPANGRGIAAFKKLNGVDYPARFELTIENQILFNGKEQALVGVITDAKPVA